MAEALGLFLFIFPHGNQRSNLLSCLQQNDAELCKEAGSYSAGILHNTANPPGIWTHLGEDFAELKALESKAPCLRSERARGTPWSSSAWSRVGFRALLEGPFPCHPPWLTEQRIYKIYPAKKHHSFLGLGLVCSPIMALEKITQGLT